MEESADITDNNYFLADAQPEDYIIDYIKNEKLTPPFKKQSVDCSQLSKVLEEVRRTDQGIRNGTISNSVNYDSINRDIVLTALEECSDEELDNLSAQDNLALFLVVQHQPDIIGYYIEDFEAMEKTEKLYSGLLPVMYDRLLMTNNQPQIFGSQVKDGKIYKMIEHSNRDSLRQAHGLNTLQEYRKSMNINRMHTTPRPTSTGAGS